VGGGVLPFASTGAAGLNCIKAQGASTTCPPSTGNFGYAHFDQYVTSVCSTGSTQEAPNMANGVDHGLTVYTGGTAVNEDCYDAGPNTTNTETGTTTTNFDAGMLTGGSFGAGRLARFSNDGPSYYYDNAATVNSVSASDTPLWAFIPDTTLSGVPYSCQRQRFKDLLTANPADDAGTLAQMTKCFTEYPNPTADPAICGGLPCTGTLFGNTTGPVQKPVNPFDIQRTSRFAYVPNICNPSPCSFPSGSKPVHFYSFIPIYIQSLYFQGGKAGSFDPGVQQSGNFGNKAGSMTAWVFSSHMLPGNLGDPGAPFEQNVNVVLELLR
jgi:hypothetical protein